jgi:hypothetical protein
MAGSPLFPDISSIRERYVGFSNYQARGVSPLYQELSSAIAESDELLDFVASLPHDKQQPNLVLAAIRWECGLPADGADLLLRLRGAAERVRSTVVMRDTQTNEPARCATLLPILTSLPQPLALLEVGASAGLCLLPDRYGYRYGGVEIAAPPDTDAPVFECRTSDVDTMPRSVPDVVWRAGLDLRPIDLSDRDQARWLRNLIWPGQEKRRTRFDQAMEVARDDPPRVEQGDLVQDFERIAAEAPSEATLVIFHTAVLNYVAEEERDRFVRMVSDLDAVWLSNEGMSVFPRLTAAAGQGLPRDRFLLSVDGVPTALTGFHGQTFEWLEAPA